MTDTFLRFHALHHQAEPLLLPNAWDARSAAACTVAGFAAVGTSSAAMADMLGYSDGEQLPFATLLYLVSRMRTATPLPLTVDFEGGYSRSPQQVAEHLHALLQLGVVGINLEDSVVETGQRRMRPLGDMVALMEYLRHYCAEHELAVFINLRTDTYLLPGKPPLPETLTRAAAYAAAGADGLFVPGLTDLTDIRTLHQGTPLPLNVMALPQLPPLADLATVGIRRVSMGNFLYEAASPHSLAQHVARTRSLTPLFA
ncbi:isocitrate lyase/PEP mutase family protein [Hymenobacter pini]|uniref:isocitrate lyase/PEP mutase family protein n=1 Tax=Hymenobacter pini TaxID=2880879 RepID=UPI001CF2DEC1|nr:isocitrate lyase/phosphoenolpyruvate mutase family protein [Hymenobacter pini]MCA8830082.1 isocitrate lyase/phosphoenolpyruvate mutase family protein [Hymenobacter pini]